MLNSTLILLLQLTAALLASVSQNPTTSPALTEQAIDLSQQAIEVVNEQLNDGLTSVLADDVFDTMWKKTFHYTTFFEDLSGFVTEGNVYSDPNSVELHTRHDEGNRAYLLKQAFWQGLATFSQKSYFRTAIIGNTPNASVYIVVGRALNEEGDQYYGFRIVNTTLYGVTSNNGTSNESRVVLGEFNKDLVYNLEARYYPGEKVQFYVDPTKSDQNPKGVLTTNLPSTKEVGNMHLMNLVVDSNDGDSKHLQLSFFEYLQSRDVLQ